MRTTTSIVGAVCVFLLASCDDGEARFEKEFEKAVARKEAETIPVAQASIDQAVRLLIDPMSATFRDVRIFDNGTICGEINSKNRMGGYVGFQRFAIVGSRTLILSDANTDPSVDDFENDRAETRKFMEIMDTCKFADVDAVSMQLEGSKVISIDLSLDEIAEIGGPNEP